MAGDGQRIVFRSRDEDELKMLQWLLANKRRMVWCIGLPIALLMCAGWYYRCKHVPDGHNFRLFDENGGLVASGTCESSSFIDQKDGTWMIRVRLRSHRCVGSDPFDYDLDQDGEFVRSADEIKANLHPAWFDHNIRLLGVYTGDKAVGAWTYETIAGRFSGGMFVIGIDRQFPDGI
jgi:hypothetical protein